MLKGQAATAYRDYMNKSMMMQPKEEPAKQSGLLSRNKPVEEDTNMSDDNYLIDQFKILQKLRAGMRNG
tara:strand:- start:521 stop:727 length:207 start_codon:yes stop_codon:yes gene_type:complete